MEKKGWAVDVGSDRHGETRQGSLITSGSKYQLDLQVVMRGVGSV